jgi:hypothetical protein
MNVLKTNGYTQITDESSVTITVRNRGKETTTEYVGKDALFESASYSYYVLSEEPEYYKTADFSGEVPAFSSINKEARTVEGAEGSVTYNARHADIEIKLSLPEGIEQGQKVSGVVVTADGQKYGLRHIANIWRATEIGWNMDENDIYGKTITNIRYITENDVIDYPVSILVKQIEITAEAAGAKQVKISGLPEDTANAKASVSYTEASDETASMFFTTVHADEIIFIAENADVTDGIVVVNEEMVDGRTYDVTGRDYWTSQIMAGGSATAVVKGFIGSQEFIGKNVGNEDFVKILYKVFFNPFFWFHIATVFKSHLSLIRFM